MIKRTMITVATLLLTGLPVTAFCAEVSEVSVDFETGTINIFGNDFGNAPNLLIYDTFENKDALPESKITLQAAVEGSWTWMNEFYSPTYASKGRSGSRSVVAVSHEGMQQFRKDLGAVQEIYFSYWVRLDGDFFPGDRVSGPRTFSEDSSFKMVWLWDQDFGGKSSDVCLPTHVGGGRFYLAGNDFNMVTGVGNDWWSWDNWMRLSFWLKANPDDPTLPGTVTFETLSLDKGYELRSYNTPVFDADGVEPKVYRTINFPGWVRSMEANTQILYDDIYIATGPNAASRVEVGNSEVLDEVTRLDLLKVENWSETSISASFPTLTKEDLEEMYLYITTADGSTNRKGIPLIARPSKIQEILVN